MRRFASSSILVLAGLVTATLAASAAVDVRLAVQPDTVQLPLDGLHRPVVRGPLKESAGVSPRRLAARSLAAGGLTNKAIGQALGISDRTVQGHLANIYGKLQVGSRTEAVTKALQQGWITIE